MRTAIHRGWAISLAVLPLVLGAPAQAETPDGMEDAAQALAPETPAAPDPAASDPAPQAELPEAAAAKAPTLGEVGYDEQGRQGRIHVVVRGDTLWHISDAYLGTPWVWPSIWNDNDDIANPHRIYPGDRVWITPWEMRRLSAAEAERMLAAHPAAPDPAPEVVSEPPMPQPAVDRKVFHRESAEEMVGLVSEEIVDSSASIVSAVPSRVMLGQGDRVYIGQGREDVAKGDRFTIFRTREKVFDPETGRMLGWHVDYLGWLEVIEPADETSVAEIRLSGAEIELGDRLLRREPPQLDIEIGPSPTGVEGRISFFPNMRTLMATQDFVYLNRGSEDGLSVGSPLEVYRDGYTARETARDENVRVPERVVAHLLVLRAQPKSSVAVVRSSQEELALGDRFRGASEAR